MKELLEVTDGNLEAHLKKLIHEKYIDKRRETGLGRSQTYYVIDQWFETVVKAHCAGRVELFRYADDLVICCQYEHDAQCIRKALVGRLSKFNLQLKVEKTNQVPFSKRACHDGYKPGVFDFLGLTFYWGRHVRNKHPLPVIWGLFCLKLEGHIRYYGVSYNLRAISIFRHQALRILFKHLNRRSQRRSFTWEQFNRYVKYHPLPKARICHALF